jgi:hypothetical protein
MNMAVDRVIQELMDLIEPPDDGHQARPSSDFAAGRSTGSNPHVGFDMNRGRGVQPHGPVTSPVYGMIKEIKPKLGRIVIEEWDPVNLEPTGYDVEILHTETRTVKEGQEVKPKQQIGTQGDVGAPGAFHAHVQVVRSGDSTRTPLNPLTHLFDLRDEYPRIGEWYLKRSLTKLIADWTPAKGLTREDAEKLGMQCAPAPKTECIYSGQVWDRVLPPGIVPKERTVTDIELRFSYLQPQSLVVKVHTHTVVDE